MATEWDTWARRYKEVSTPLWSADKREFLQSMVKPRDTVLDAGCGPGLLWSKFFEDGMVWKYAERFHYPKTAKIDAIDSNGHMIAMARMKQKEGFIAPNVHFEHMDMMKIKKKYDRIFAINVMQEPKAKEKVELLYSHLKSRGQLIANWQLKMPLHEVMKNFRIHAHHNEFLVKDTRVVGQRIFTGNKWNYKHYFAEDEMIQLLSAFKEIELYDFDWHPHLRGCLTIAHK